MPQKGIDDKRFVVDCIVEDVLCLGYAKVLMKSDNETAIVKLLKESYATLKVEGLDASEEHPPPYDSQSNGAIEAAVKQVRSRMNVLKLCLERRIGKTIPPRHPTAAWLVARCVAVIRFRFRGLDGKTPYGRVRMRPVSSRLVCFATKIKFKDRAKDDRGDEHKWHHGLFLGMSPMTGRFIM